MEKKKIKQIAIILGVLFLPLIYSTTYLKGFWDPYNNLGNIKVAIVNEDKCTKECKSTDLINKLKDSDTFNFVVKNKKDAEEGLLDKTYYATITIPKNFTSSFETADKEEKDVPTITYRTNKKTNYITSQLIENGLIRVEKEIDKEVAKEVVGKLSDNLNEVPNQTEKISTGLNQIYTGTVALNNGSIKLKDGTSLLSNSSKQVSNGINQLNEGLKTLKDGSSSLKDGTNNLSQGIKQIKAGSDEITSKVNSSVGKIDGQKQELQNGINALKGGVTSFKTNINNYNALSSTILDTMSTYYNSVTTYYESLIAGGKTLSDEEQGLYKTAKMYTLDCNTIINLNSGTQLASNLTKLVNTNSSYTGQNYGSKTIIENLKASANLLTTGPDQINNGIDTLSTELFSSLNDLSTNMNALNQGLNSLSNGINQLENGINGTNGLVNGVNRLDSGVQTIYNGSNKLNDNYKTFDSGINTLDSSVSTLKEGTNELSTGVNTAKEEVEKANDQTKDKLKALNGLDEYTKTPVKLKDNSYGKVDDYGTFFSPFFMSLSLWLGGIIIIMGLYYDPENRFNILGKYTENRIKRVIYYGIIGVAQSILLPLILVLTLNFDVTNWPLFYGSCILIGLSFLAIMLFLVFTFDDIGKFLSIVLLVIQLAACAGTFPLETEPTFFQVISPFMPMTYSVELLRESFVSIDHSLLVKDVFVLLLLLIVFSTLIIINGIYKTTKEKLVK